VSLPVQPPISLRITLAWTDLPGNPAVGPKLVNDLISSSPISPMGGSMSAMQSPASSARRGRDQRGIRSVNNVENVYIDGFFPQLPVTCAHTA
jgi:hypothetical protein